MSWDVAVAGGGPAGLAFAIHGARLGLRVLVIEREALPRDKACGEGLLPAGVRELGTLGAGELLSERDCTPFSALRYVQEDGRFLEAKLPAPGGLGIRRTALSRALTEAAGMAGAEVATGERVLRVERVSGLVRVETTRRTLTVRALVAADGLHSPLRRALGWEGAPARVVRFGLRRHLELQWPARVEVHFAEGVEAYLTPAGANRTGVAFLWEPHALGPRASFASLLAHFPALERRFAGAPFASEAMGAGPLQQNVTRTVGEGVALLGDAAGYVDALTGEGLSLAFHGARVLAGALATEPVEAALRTYEREASRAFARYGRLTHALLALARRPKLRRTALHALEVAPFAFEKLVHAALPIAPIGLLAPVTSAQAVSAVSGR